MRTLKDKRLKGQFINYIIDDDDDIMTEKIRKLTAIKRMAEITGKQVLPQARKMEAKSLRKY